MLHSLVLTTLCKKGQIAVVSARANVFKLLVYIFVSIWLQSSKPNSCMEAVFLLTQNFVHGAGKSSSSTIDRSKPF